MCPWRKLWLSIVTSDPEDMETTDSYLESISLASSGP